MSHAEIRWPRLREALLSRVDSGRAMSEQRDARVLYLNRQSGLDAYAAQKVDRTVLTVRHRTQRINRH
ncbi:hypothetical protein GCM10027081_07630 [Cupriavidus yeoncheonensis]